MHINFHLSSKVVKSGVVRTVVIFVGKARLVCVVMPDRIIKEYIYPDNVVIDGDVLNRDGLREVLMAWLLESDIKAINTILVASCDILFEKITLPDARQKTIDPTIINAFVDSIPFQHVCTLQKTLKDGSVKTIVTNRDLLVGVMHAFEKSNFNILGVYPDLQIVSENKSSAQDEDPISQAKKYIDLFESKTNNQSRFALVGQIEQKPLNQMSVAEAAQQPVNPLIAIAIVAFLIVIAVAIGYWRYYQARQKQINIVLSRTQLSKSAHLVSAKSPTLSPTQLPSPIVTQIKPPEKLLRIQLIYTPENAKLYEDVSLALRASSNYQLSDQLDSQLNKQNRILVSSDIEEDALTQLTTLLKDIGISTTSKQVEIDGYDAVIELGMYSPSVPSPSISLPTISPTP